MDTKPVLALSNYHNPTDTDNVNRHLGNGPQQSIQVPKMLADYQLHMKGVDLSDEMIRKGKSVSPLSLMMASTYNT